MHVYTAGLADIFCGVRAVLRKWKEKEGLHATYGNLLRVCEDTSTAQVICVQ